MKNIKDSYKSNKFKKTAPAQNKKNNVPDRSYSISNIQNYFKYIMKHETVTDNPPIKIYVNKVENRIVFKIKIRYSFQILKKDEITWKH